MEILTVSVIIPTYNRRMQIMHAIESVLAQTAPVDEIIVVDDGSSDDTVAAVRERFPSGVKVLTQKNAGVSAARNRGVREARGEWIAFLDSDDIWFPEKIARQLEALQAMEGEPGLCFTDNLFGGNPQMSYSRFEETGFVGGAKSGILHDPARYIVGGREPFFTSSLLIRRSLLDELGGFDEVLSIREDTDLMFRLSFKTRFCYVGESFAQIDRTPSRSLGLCNLYSTRSDSVFECSQRLYSKWLAMPEVIGTGYERPIRELLRLAHYDSAEAKIHEVRVKAALREFACLRALGEGYLSILINLVLRKIKKLGRSRRMVESPPQLERERANPELA